MAEYQVQSVRRVDYQPQWKRATRLKPPPSAPPSNLVTLHQPGASGNWKPSIAFKPVIDEWRTDELMRRPVIDSASIESSRAYEDARLGTRIRSDDLKAIARATSASAESAAASKANLDALDASVYQLLTEYHADAAVMAANLAAIREAAAFLVSDGVPAQVAARDLLEALQGQLEALQLTANDSLSSRALPPPAPSPL